MRVASRWEFSAAAEAEFEGAKTAALKAIEIDPDSSRRCAHLGAGSDVTSWPEWDWEGARAGAFKQAIELKPRCGRSSSRCLRPLPGDRHGAHRRRRIPQRIEDGIWSSIRSMRCSTHSECMGYHS